MDRKWLEERDAEFHKRQYAALCAQLVLCCEMKLPYEHLVRDQMRRLAALGKVTEKDASTIEVDVRVELAETWSGLKDPVELEPKPAPAPA